MLREILDFIQMIGNTSAEVYEWSEKDVRTKRLSNSPNFSKLTKQLPSITFNGLRLAHAVVKADYLDQRNLTMPGIGFLLQASNLIDFGTAPIKLKPGASQALNDFSLTSFSGRVGQGMAILYGHSLGMKFSAHLRSHVEALPVGSPGASHIKDAMADFLFADDQKTVLIESKGSFKLAQNEPTAIKAVLKGGLINQIDPWMDYLDPAPANGYVVYSCLRESSGAPSALFVVDPEGGDGQNSDVPFSVDQVRRENYGAWLRAMGLGDAANRLAPTSDIRREPVDELFVIHEFNSRLYAFREQHYPWPALSHWPVPVMGIDLMVLRAIASFIRGRKVNEHELLRVDLPQAAVHFNETASIFPDGSILVSQRLAPVDLEIVRL